MWQEERLVVVFCVNVSGVLADVLAREGRLEAGGKRVVELALQVEGVEGGLDVRRHSVNALLQQRLRGILLLIVLLYSEPLLFVQGIQQIQCIYIVIIIIVNYVDIVYVITNIIYAVVIIVVSIIAVRINVFMAIIQVAADVIGASVAASGGAH